LTTVEDMGMNISWFQILRLIYSDFKQSWDLKQILNPGSNFHYRMVGLRSTQSCQSGYFIRNLGLGARYFVASGYRSHIMGRLGSSTAFCSDHVVDSDHDQSTKCSCKKSSLTTKCTLQKLDFKGIIWDPVQDPTVFVVRAYLRDDPFCGDFILGFVLPLCSGWGSGKTNYYYYYNTKIWHNTKPSMRTSMILNHRGYGWWYFCGYNMIWLIQLIPQVSTNYILA
jgi:hypothetical protein